VSAPRSKTKRRARRKVRFSLVELLIVIAIISGLVAMLLPALTRGKVQARFARWASFSVSIRGDDTLLVYYNFMDESTGALTLKNQAHGYNDIRWKKTWGDMVEADPKPDNPNNADSFTAPHSHGIATGVQPGIGRWGKPGVYFSGVNDDHYRSVKFRWRADLGANTKNPITVMWWQLVEADEIGGRSVFSIGNDSHRSAAHAPWSNGSIYWDYGGCCGSDVRINTAGGFYNDHAGKWTHIALVSEGNNGNYKAIYVDGELVIESTGASNGPDIQKQNLTLGQMENDSGPFKGIIDEFMVYTRVLHADEIKAHYVTGTP
jgi:hypothetical protein